LQVVGEGNAETTCTTTCNYKLLKIVVSNMYQISCQYNHLHNHLQLKSLKKKAKNIFAGG
jgi:hypothetical protein